MIKIEDESVLQDGGVKIFLYEHSKHYSGKCLFISYFEWFRLLKVNREELETILKDDSAMILNSKHPVYGEFITFCLTHSITHYKIKIVNDILYTKMKYY